MDNGKKNITKLSRGDVKIYLGHLKTNRDN